MKVGYHQIPLQVSTESVMESGCLAASSDNFENVLRDLPVSDKGKFKWSGTFENLEIMMNNILEKQTVWNSSGGDCKKLELDDLCVRWYMKNKSLTINGEGSEDLKSQLNAAVCVAESDAAASQQPNVSEVVESDDEPECESVLLSYTLWNPATQSPAVSASVLELVQSLEERLECKLEKLASQIEELSSASLQQLIHEPNDASQSTEYSAFLKSENTSLKKQNMVLAEQVNGFKMMISDLKTKIKDLDNEKNRKVKNVKRPDH